MKFTATTFVSFTSLLAVALAAPAQDVRDLAKVEPEERAVGLLLAGAALSASLQIAAKSIFDGIKNDKYARGEFTKHLVEKLHSENPGFNYVVCHTDHKASFEGEEGKDWSHRHEEFDIKIGGTIGYEIYNGKKGEFQRNGDGGYLNWAWMGKTEKVDDDGKHIVWAEP